MILMCCTEREHTMQTLTVGGEGQSPAMSYDCIPIQCCDSVSDRCNLVSQQVEEAGGWGLLEPAMSSFKHAFAVEESHRGFMRGLKSIL